MTAYIAYKCRYDNALPKESLAPGDASAFPKAAPATGCGGAKRARSAGAPGSCSPNAGTETGRPSRKSAGTTGRTRGGTAAFRRSDTAGRRLATRSEERRVGKEWVRKCKDRGSPYP